LKEHVVDKIIELINDGKEREAVKLLNPRYGIDEDAIEKIEYHTVLFAGDVDLESLEECRIKESDLCTHESELLKIGTEWRIVAKLEKEEEDGYVIIE
jgi:hypothetical protein